MGYIFKLKGHFHNTPFKMRPWNFTFIHKFSTVNYEKFNPSHMIFTVMPSYKATLTKGHPSLSDKLQKQSDTQLFLHCRRGGDYCTSNKNCGICVLFPLPVSPATTVTLLRLIWSTTVSLCWKTGRFCRVLWRVLYLSVFCRLLHKSNRASLSMVKWRFCACVFELEEWDNLVCDG